MVNFVFWLKDLVIQSRNEWSHMSVYLIQWNFKFHPNNLRFKWWIPFPKNSKSYHIRMNHNLVGIHLPFYFCGDAMMINFKKSVLFYYLNSTKGKEKTRFIAQWKMTNEWSGQNKNITPNSKWDIIRLANWLRSASLCIDTWRNLYNRQNLCGEVYFLPFFHCRSLQFRKKIKPKTKQTEEINRRHHSWLELVTITNNNFFWFSRFFSLCFPLYSSFSLFFSLYFFLSLFLTMSLSLFL